jgi:hypothetical protein
MLVRSGFTGVCDLGGIDNWAGPKLR